MAKLKKSLPKRCSNDKLKARRQRSWQNGEQRKVARVAAQRERELANKRTRTEGGLTPHEVKLLVASRKPKDPKRIRNDVGNFLVDKVVTDEHGPVIIRGIEPCCNAKSYKKCHCTPKVNVLSERERYDLMRHRSQTLMTLADIV